MTVVLDASAVLALIYDEAGSDTVQDHIADAFVSSVNAAEVMSKLSERETPQDMLDQVWGTLSYLCVNFSGQHALRASQLRAVTRAHRLSLGDRACLATADLLGVAVLTSDRAWGKLDLGIDIKVIR